LDNHILRDRRLAFKLGAHGCSDCMCSPTNLSNDATSQGVPPGGVAPSWGGFQGRSPRARSLWARSAAGSPRRGLGRAAALAFALVAAGCATGAKEPAPATFRVMTYNIHHGEGADGKIDLERIAAVIKEAQADIVGLQEVDKGVRRTQRRDLPAELAALTGLTCLFTNNFPYQGGEYGNAVLTRFPVVRWTNTHLQMLHTNEQRGVMQVLLKAAGRELLFMTTHIDYHREDTERLRNVAEFKQLIGKYGRLPIVFCGDFNDPPASRTYRAMVEQFEDVWAMVGQADGFTIPSQRPNKRIDYIWIRRDSPLTPLKAWVPSSGASDHLPVVAEFRWQPDR
jgi:endonuclease/exonuclease/phosphatase family metal-dependent hydrolase